MLVTEKWEYFNILFQEDLVKKSNHVKIDSEKKTLDRISCVPKNPVQIAE